MGRVLTFVYGLFAIAATARASVQILTKFDEARVAYLLSLLAGLIYIAATVGLALGKRGRKLAIVCCSIEFIGVVVVGAVSLAKPEAFPDATVWSHFGEGYGYIPLVLPLIGLFYLLRRRNSTGVAI
ncbi:MAG TPA: hypothetical protein DGG94_23510 [Micromonosporaceae bacterium]|nr:hypothetical protein [Micromonosporaceae bacterium]HCU52718.1 hypothetical protein [Micromonosporaceae bacterium]